MTKSYYKILILLLLLWTISACVKNNHPIRITGCTYILGNKDCSMFEKSLLANFDQASSHPIVNIQKHANNNFGAILSLYRELTDFAMVQVSILEDFPRLIHPDLRGVIPLFYVPLLIVVRESSGIQYFNHLKNKRIGLDVDHSTSFVIAQKLLKLNNISYTPVFAKDVDLPYLLQDNAFDAYFCFSMSCVKSIQDAASSGEKIRLLSIPYNSIPSSIFHSHIYKYSAINLKPYKPYIVNENDKIFTLGSYIGLFTTQRVSDEVVLKMAKTIQENLKKDTYENYTALNAPYFRDDIPSPLFPGQGFFYKTLHESMNEKNIKELKLN